MSVVPVGKAQMLAFFEERAPVWAADPTAIGLTLDQSNSLTAAVGAAATKFAAAQSARAQSRSATIEQNAALDELADLGAQLIKIIRAYGLQTGSDEVFALAQIPLPKEPEPIPPVAPTKIEFNLDTAGALTVSWSGNKSPGQIYAVWRSVSSEPSGQFGPMTQVATTGDKFWVDTTLPGGVVRAMYMIQAVKGAAKVNSDQKTLNFVYSLNNGQQELSLAA